MRLDDLLPHRQAALRWRYAPELDRGGVDELVQRQARTPCRLRWGMPFTPGQSVAVLGDDGRYHLLVNGFPGCGGKPRADDPVDLIRHKQWCYWWTDGWQYRIQAPSDARGPVTRAATPHGAHAGAVVMSRCQRGEHRSHLQQHRVVDQNSLRSGNGSLMHQVRVTFSHDRQAAGGTELQTAVREILADLRAQPQVLGGDSAAPTLPAIDVTTTDVEIHEQGQGMTPATTGIIVTVASQVATGVATDLAADAIMDWWKNTVWRRIRRRVGDDALGTQHEEIQIAVEVVQTLEPTRMRIDLAPPGLDLRATDDTVGNRSDDGENPQRS
jgi:hypothetical protein